ERALIARPACLRAAVRAGKRATLPRARGLRHRRNPGARDGRRLGRRPRTARREARAENARAPRRPRVKVVLLSGGGGGARFARGLQGLLEPGELTVIGNVGDDVEILGLRGSPDLDSLLYTLAGLVDADRGWGRAHETWHALESAGDWGGEDWFRLGDRDIGLHLVRTNALLGGATLTEVTAQLARRVELETSLVPASDDP